MFCILDVLTTLSSHMELELASFDLFQHVGYVSHSFLSRNLIFNAEFQNSIIPGNFQKFPGSQDIALELVSDFLP